MVNGWLRRWFHCMWRTVRSLAAEDHRMVTEYGHRPKGQTLWSISRFECTCGQVFYVRPKVRQTPRDSKIACAADQFNNYE